MSEKINAHCGICGKGYHLCLHCNKDNSAAWKMHTDTAEHYKIFQILRGNTIKVYSDKEAAEKLKNVDLSDMNTFLPEVKAEIKRILGTAEKDKQHVKPDNNTKPKKADGDKPKV